MLVGHISWQSETGHTRLPGTLYSICHREVCGGQSPKRNYPSVLCVAKCRGSQWPQPQAVGMERMARITCWGEKEPFKGEGVVSEFWKEIWEHTVAEAWSEGISGRGYSKGCEGSTI